ncbi:sulfurtransferase [Herbaspirillum sp. AP02]|uniref:sulfurtransferase n=1 Tax=unclassified Herbaspirillum TaxID=2624150 RepID=UPI0015D9E21A|nr:MULTISPECIES: sulfurtransferase [unclassified Herbaspirillum]MBG7621080.1 sulfurtransferase [Herbaspirillum sp. AP02]NZD68809.1 sulfurtransferase [Herbaspirillum sp. AP21]
MQSPDTPYVNIAAYKFVSFDDTAEKRPEFLAFCQQHNLRGTVILSPEGINLFLAGLRPDIDAFLAWLRADPRFTDLIVKESYSEKQPFTRMLVKLKAEIITMKHPLIKPELGRAPFVEPTQLKRWLDQGHDDEGRPVVMVDTRNGFEVDVGTFENTVDYRINKFTEFPQVIEDHRADFAGKTVVTFCTGGIRCEKAAIHMQNIGYDHVYQLEGGILKYFEDVGGAHYNGDCFVFDYRTALSPELKETQTAQCFACRAVVTPREQLSPDYVPGKSCPHCASVQRKGQETQETASAQA